MRNALSLRVVFVASVFVAAEPLTFMLENNDKQWTFREGSAVTLVCKNSPYTGIHEFSFNSTRTFSCLSRTCYTLYDDRGNFSFKYDMDSGVFTWTINRVKMSYDEHLFVCFDGEHKIEHLVKVSKEGDSNERHRSDLLYIAYVGAPLFVTGTCIISWFVCRHCTTRNIRSCRTQTYNMPPEQSNMIEIEMGLNSSTKPDEDKTCKQSNITEIKMGRISPRESG